MTYFDIIIIMCIALMLIFKLYKNYFMSVLFSLSIYSMILNMFKLLRICSMILYMFKLL